MPVDDYGIRADIIMNSSAVFNRMNPSQWIEQDVNRTDYFVIENMKKMSANDAYKYLVEYLSFINPKWGELVERIHCTEQLKMQLVSEVLEKGVIYKQVSPYQKGTDENFILNLSEKYPHPKTPVQFNIYDAQGDKHHIRTRKAISIGDEYIILLYKTPHLSSAGVAYVNQFHTPIRPSSYGKLQYPFSQTPIRLGEDEGRNITMVAGAPVMARIIGMYANSTKAVNLLEYHLLHDKHPSQLDKIEMDTPTIVKNNAIVGVARHIFSCLGINIAPIASSTNVTMNMPEVEEKNEE